MALTDDSRALLQLLLGKGQSYADIADLLGVSEDEVRSRARAALTEISDRDPDENVPLTDYLLGQADPITRADVARHLADDPDDQELADTLTAQLRLLAPSATLPKPNRPGIAPARKPRRSTATGSGSASDADADTEPKPRRSVPLAANQRWLIALLLGAALLITIIILVVAGVFGGDDSKNSDNASNPAPTTAILQPVSGESGKGNVEFGFSGSDLAANLQLNDLTPSTKGESYATWLTGPKGIAYPINQGAVGDSKAISGQVTINQAVICFIAADAFTGIKVSRVQNADMRTALTEASKANKGQGDFPKYTGDTVLQGSISMPAKAKKQVLPTCDAATSGATTGSTTGQ
jgi:Sigma-70, region 4